MIIVKKKSNMIEMNFSKICVLGRCYALLNNLFLIHILWTVFLFVLSNKNTNFNMF